MRPAFSLINTIAKRHRAMFGADDVTFRGVRVECVINQQPTVSWADGTGGEAKRQPQFLPRGMSVVRALSDAINPMPVTGEVFTESNGKTHRVQEIQAFRDSFLCLCKCGSVPTSEGKP